MKKRQISLNLVNEQLKNDAAGTVLQYERDFEKRLEGVIELAEQKRVALMSGPSCSGKTTASLILKDRLAKMGHRAYTIALDNFFVNRKSLPRLSDGKLDFESINTIDIELLKKTLGTLAAGEETPMPVYDFYSGTRRNDSYRVRLKSGDVAIIEGLHALNVAITDRVGVGVAKIYVNVCADFAAPDGTVLDWRDLRFVRRVVRDAKFRGYPPLKTAEVWEGVLEAEKENILPFADKADLVLDTAIEYEWNHLKSYAVPLLQALTEDKRYGEYSQRMLNAISGLYEFDFGIIPSDALVREFTGGSKYADENGAR